MMNENKPLWTRSPSEVSEEEYVDFFKSISKSDDAPLKHIHFVAEGQTSFRGLIYIPKKAPHDLYDKYYSGKNRALSLYVNRVLLSNEIDAELLPQYLGFIKGVIDSSDLPISVSRESFQKSRHMRVIARNVAKRVLSMIEALADEKAEDSEKEGEEPAETPYEQFWGQFSRSIKLGILGDDETNRKRLVKLLRFTSTKSPKKIISLAQYVERMPEEQKDIYYISGPDQASVEKSPMLEQLNRRGFEVLFFVDNLDEYLASGVPDFEGKKLVSVTKEGLEFGEETEEEIELQKDLDVDFKPTLDFVKEELGDKVGKVVVSRRIVDSPAVLVSTRWGWSANMERIMRAQAMSQEFESQKFMMGSRTLEINPDHPIVQEVKSRLARGEKESVSDIVRLLYDSALLNSGYVHEDVADFVQRLNNIMASNLNVDAKPSGERYVPPKRPVEEAAEGDDADEVDDEADDVKDEL
jgi:heat shock protein beta